MSDIPSLCSKCLGDDNVRMIKQPEGETCKICTRPFTVFRWQTDNGTKRSNKTIICKTCSTTKNCCQSCMLDLNFLIPIDMRDTALKMAGLEHLVGHTSSSRNSEVKAIIADKQQKQLENGESINTNEKAHQLLTKLAKSLNKAPKDVKVSSKKSVDTSIPNDLAKVIQKLPFNGSITIPDNQLTSFFIFGFPEDTPQYVISDYFEEFGKLKSVSIVHRARCGFITFNSRKSAEMLAQKVLSNGLNTNTQTAGLAILQNSPVRIVWSDVKPLIGDHSKIALVVKKVMLQLAEKDQKYNTKAISGPKTSKSQSKAKSKPGRTKTSSSSPSSSREYESAKTDFEL